MRVSEKKFNLFQVRIQHFALYYGMMQEQTPNTKLTEWKKVIIMEEKTGESCEFFMQHYGMRGGRVFWIHCGHCTFSKVFKTRPDKKACAHYVPGESDRDGFVSKEYLRKELLQYMMKLEIMPEIERGDEP